MGKLNNFLFLCFLSLLSSRTFVKKCGDEVIENCAQCGTDDKADTCIECNDKHFLFFHNLFCIPCDDPLYGQVGCGGNCDATDYLETRNVICEKDGCKEGYYYLNGFCTECFVGSYGCKRCNVTLNENNEKEFKCLECIDDYYLDQNDGRCYYYGCNSHCKKCHVTLVNDNKEKVCDECYNGYYLEPNSYHNCKKCKNNVEIANGYCQICSDNEKDYEFGTCWCNNYYTLKGHSNCVKCPDNCPYCQYNEKDNIVECLSCDPGYILNNEKKCSYCGQESEDKCLECVENCQLCNIKKTCLECKPGYILLNDGTCGKCPSHCGSCKANEKNEIFCSKCEDHYALKENECIYCPSITDEGMQGCSRCGYDKVNNKFECYECLKKENYDSYSLYNAYTYVINTNQCLNNTDKDQPSFYHCQTSYKNGDKYECLICNNNEEYYSYVIKVINDKICKSVYEINLNSNCNEAENIGEEGNPIYSCTNCDDYVAKITVKEDGRTICEYRSGSLEYCMEGELDDNNYKCTKCVPNAHFNSDNICECDPDSFSKYYAEWCYKCDDKSYGNPGCDAEKGCNYYTSNDQLNCNECKEGYFNYTEGQCFSCSDEINGCKDCHLDNSDNLLICDQCLEGYIYNGETNQCESGICENHREISEGCIICGNNKEEYIANKKCSKCTYGFFKTKDNQCINCSSEAYGGDSCNECMYELDENNEETDKIICSQCSSNDNIISTDGKCINCHKSVQNCELCEYNKNKENSKNITCTLCKPGFYLNSEGKCINYIKYLETIPNCKRYLYHINNISFCTYYYENNYYDNDYYRDYYDNYYSTYYCRYVPSDYYNFSYTDYYNRYDFKNYKQIQDNLNLDLDFNIPVINNTLKSKCIR